MIAWRETCAEGEVSGQHSPRGQSFPRPVGTTLCLLGVTALHLSGQTHTTEPVRLCADVGLNIHEGTCVLVGPSMPNDLFGGVVTCGKIHTKETCPFLWLRSVKHTPRNLCTCRAKHAQRPVRRCVYMWENARQGNMSIFVVTFDKTHAKELVCVAA